MLCWPLFRSLSLSKTIVQRTEHLRMKTAEMRTRLGHLVILLYPLAMLAPSLQVREKSSMYSSSWAGQCTSLVPLPVQSGGAGADSRQFNLLGSSFCLCKGCGGLCLTRCPPFHVGVKCSRLVAPSLVRCFLLCGGYVGTRSWMWGQGHSLSVRTRQRKATMPYWWLGGEPLRTPWQRWLSLGAK
jgi:hypothetical protein